MSRAVFAGFSGHGNSSYETHKVLWDFEIQTNYQISARLTDLVIIKKKKKIENLVDFTDLADQRAKFLKSEKKDKYLDLARGLKKLFNMVSVIPTVIGALGMIPKIFCKGI